MWAAKSIIKCERSVILTKALNRPEPNDSKGKFTHREYNAE